VAIGRLASGALLAVLLLSGCALLGGGDPEPLDTYELTAPAPARAPRRPGTQILVAEPTAIKALDSESIVIKPSPATIQYLSGAQWADRLPRIVQARLVEAFQSSGRIGVGKPGEGLAIDYQIIIDIRSFEIRLDGTDRAEIELFVRILNDRNGVVRTARLFTATVAVGAGGNGAFVAALDRAFGIAAAEIVEWTVSQI
jgi:cholesterol transport system auxiliary component